MTLANIPYGAWWSTPFARWLGALAHLHALAFAAWTAKQEIAARNIDPGGFDHGILSTIIPQHGTFYRQPWVGGLLGAPGLAGPMVARQGQGFALDPPKADGPWIPLIFNRIRSRGLARHA